MLPSPNDIAGTRFLMSGKAEKERAERFRIILNEPDIVRVDYPTDAKTPGRITVEDAQGNVVFDQVVNIYNPIVYNALERIEGDDIEIVKEGDIPFIGGTRSFLELKSISENLSRYHNPNPQPPKTSPFKAINERKEVLPPDIERPVNRTPGTVYFELYQQGNGGFSAGSLLQWYFPPDPVNEDGQIEVWDDKAKHVTPHYVLFLLFADAMKGQGKEYYPPEELPAYPVATIAFKWDELKTRLNEITEGQLTTPGAMPPNLTNEAAQKMNGILWHGGDILKGEGKTTGLCWYVPLDRLQDIATVTIIGNPERATLEAAVKRSTKYKYPATLMDVTRMEQRLNYLKELAKQEDGSIRRIE